LSILALRALVQPEGVGYKTSRLRGPRTPSGWCSSPPTGPAVPSRPLVV